MKQHKSIFFILPIIALVLISCQFATIEIQTRTVRASGNLESETRQVSGFERVTLEGTGELTLIQGDEEGLTIEADDNLLPLLTTEVRGRELVLSVEDGVIITNQPTIRYTLKVKDLSYITVEGAASVRADGLDAKNLTLIVSGTGSVNLSGLKVETLSAEANGSGNFNLEGETVKQSLTINGAGNYETGNLRSQEARVEINGAGNATLWAAEKLDINISGFGNVKYYGTPEITQEMAGGGAVEALGEHK